jgi:hypothetical protein
MLRDANVLRYVVKLRCAKMLLCVVMLRHAKMLHCVTVLRDASTLRDINLLLDTGMSRDDSTLRCGVTLRSSRSSVLAVEAAPCRTDSFASMVLLKAVLRGVHER